MEKWSTIENEQELYEFYEAYGGFHDCCLKELKYISGAFVNQNLGMHPVNDQRNLSIIFQRQSKECTTIEIEFSQLIILNLLPNDERYTCEILDAVMFFEDGNIYWGDSEWFREQREKYKGTWLCAKKARWRVI